MQKRSHSKWLSAFSLVEISIALGIAVFGIVGMLGLLSASMSANSASDRDTVIASMSRRVMGDLRSRAFDALWEENPWKVSESKVSSQGSGLPATHFFFKFDGTLLVDSNGAPLGPNEAAKRRDVFYECVVAKA